MIRINQIRVPVGYKRQDVEKAILKKTRLRAADLVSWEILRESVDARKTRGRRGGSHDAPSLAFTLSVRAVIRGEKAYLRRTHSRDITAYVPKHYTFPYEHLSSKLRPVVIGSGPAGLFAALMLARAGLEPLVLERGSDVDTRIKKVQSFWEGGKLDPDTNVQFGEGGVGTFSDGKLNTLVKDPSGLHRKVLEEFVLAGAPSEILYKHRPHLGTDALVDIVKNIRSEILRLGGEFCFDSCVTDFHLDASGRLQALTVNGSRKIRASRAILAVGHSARDTYQKLFEIGMDIEQKAFAIGVRIEHPQEMINLSQYGMADSPVGAADYRLSCRSSLGRSVYSFCMCPGGWVVNAASEPGALAVNGMSYRGRDSRNANSALIVNVAPEDFGSTDPLAGVRFQRRWERLAWEEGNGAVPVQLFGDFKDGRISTGFGDVQPVHKGDVCFGDLHRCLPDYVCRSLIEGIGIFGGKIRGFDREDAILSGVETRTSSPIRMLRDEHLESSLHGIFPCGEGAGYAGGITSAAMDGIRAAQALARDIAENKR